MKKSIRNSLREGPLFAFMSVSLKGISQVILIENAITGLLILIAITISSYFLGVITLLSAMIGTLVGKLGGADEKSINQGLFGYNSVLTGMALALLLNGPYQWIFALIGSALAALLTATMMHFMKKVEIPVLTLPFIILTWSTLLASYKLEEIKLSTALIPQNLSSWKLNTAGEIHLLDGIFNGIGQIFFFNHAISGMLISIAVFLAGRKLGFYVIIGNVAALLTSYLLGGERTLIMMGLYGYNAILTILAVSVAFNNKNKRYAPLAGIIAACLTVPITASTSAWLLPYGLPALTMPFVLSTWLVLGARKALPNF